VQDKHDKLDVGDQLQAMFFSVQSPSLADSVAVLFVAFTWHKDQHIF
jgi:hypothetical protein